MKTNTLLITIQQPLERVFEFTTNPKNTHAWIPFIISEVAETYPPKLGTIYKNTSDWVSWTEYKVEKWEKNKLFVLSECNGNYTVEYTYTELDDWITEMQYKERVITWELESPFSQNILENLKKILEK